MVQLSGSPFGLPFGHGSKVFEDLAKNMRSEWEMIAAARRRYEEAFTELTEFQRWRGTATPAKPLQPLGEEDVPSGLINNWLIGCDPEFVVLDAAGRVVSVNNILPANGVVGYDHSGDVIEIRPEPAHGTYALVKRLQKEILTNKYLEPLANHRWRAGAYIRARVPRLGGERILTLGGHVHIDQPPKQYGEDEEDHDLRIDALDRGTQWLEGLDILAQSESQARRSDPNAIRNRYGQFGDWRPAGKGGRPRMEYRTMCSWLYDPRAAYLALTVAKLATQTPEITLESLKKGRYSWSGLGAWLENYRTKDTNARRALERLFDGGKRVPKMDPAAGFRDNWRSLNV